MPRVAPALALSALALVGGCDWGDGGAGSGGGGPARVDHPNVVVVMTDDQDRASMAVMPTVKRKLVARGTEFTRFFTTYPECGPSRATFLTGQYAHNHGVLSNDPPDGGFDAFRDANTLPVWLRGVGYRTAYFGKYLNGYGWAALGNEPAYVPPGWSRWAALTDHTEYQMYGYDLNLDGRVRAYGDAPADYQTDVLARLASRFIQRAAGSKPFLVTVAPLAPHDEGVLEGEPEAPRNPRPAPRDLGRFGARELPTPASFDEADVADKPDFVRKQPRLDAAARARLTTLYRSRLESLLAVDDMVGRLLGALRRAGELGQTVVVFTSDNGFLLGQHRLVGKDVVYDEAAEVPLVVRGPGFPRGAVRRQIVGNVDLAPTIARLAGAEPGRRVDGSALPAQAQSAEAGAAGRILLEVLAAHRVAAVRTPGYLYAKYATGERELYDLRADPGELTNLAADPAYGAIRARLAAQLARLRDCAGAGCR
jgi:N-acetylglucosamine-6-sulfatase